MFFHEFLAVLSCQINNKHASYLLFVVVTVDSFQFGLKVSIVYSATGITLKSF